MAEKFYLILYLLKLVFMKNIGGVVPEIASRCHIEVINQIVKEGLVKAGKTLRDIDIVAVTFRPSD